MTYIRKIMQNVHGTLPTRRRKKYIYIYLFFCDFKHRYFIDNLHNFFSKQQNFYESHIPNLPKKTHYI